MKLLLILLIVVGLVLLSAIALHIFDKTKPAKPQTQYTQPIGPTQTPPYQLESALIEEVDHA